MYMISNRHGACEIARPRTAGVGERTPPTPNTKGALGEPYDQVPEVKTWIESVSANPKANESLLLFVRFHPLPRLAIFQYLFRAKATQAWAQRVYDAVAAAQDINGLCDDIAQNVRLINLVHRGNDPAFAQRFEAEQKLRDDLGATIKIGTWRRVRAYRVRAVLEADDLKIKLIGRDFIEAIVRADFPSLYRRIKQSEVPVTIEEWLGWSFKAQGKRLLQSDARFKHIVEHSRPPARTP